VFQPGDIVEFDNLIAGKRKWHLCVNADRWFLNLNSPKDRAYPGDLEVDCAALPGIPATVSGKSIISCNMVLRMPDEKLGRCRPQKVGTVSVATAQDITAHVRGLRVLSVIEKKPILDGLGGVA